MVKFEEVIKSSEYKNSEAKLPIALGKDESGNNVVVDLAKMPHLLIAGTTGSGKSVCLDTIVMSLSKQKDVRVILVDPKIVGLSIYNGADFLVKDCLSDISEIRRNLETLVSTMNLRYKKMAELRVRDIESFNKVSEEKMDRLVVIIDEFADLVFQSKSIQDYITMIAQKSRACGIHLVLATQRPTVDVVTGLIKANVPARIALKVATSLDSRVILDRTGAEELNGNGDMLLQIPGEPLRRLQGAYVTEEEIKAGLTFKDTEDEAEEKEIPSVGKLQRIHRISYTEAVEMRNNLLGNVKEEKKISSEEELSENSKVYLDYIRNNPIREVSKWNVQRILRCSIEEAESVYNELISIGILEE